MILLKEYMGHLGDPYIKNTKAIDVETGEFVPTTSKNKIIFAMASKIHCEIELNQVNANKTLIPFLEYYSNSKNIQLNIHKYIVLRNIECLKKETQNALRRIVETNQSKIRCIMTINSLSNLIKPLQSRFLCFSVSSPSFEQTKKIIDNICTTYNIKITSKKKEDIINESKYGSSGIINLNELFLIIEGSILCSKEKKELSLSKIYISERNEASNLLLKEIKKGNIEEIRNILYKIYEIMKNDFSLIINDFSRKLLNNVDDKLKKEIIYLSARWDSEINKNYILNPIFQAEGYLYHMCDLLKV